jgi:hypothetical protein
MKNLLDEGRILAKISNAMMEIAFRMCHGVTTLTWIVPGGRSVAAAFLARLGEAPTGAPLTISTPARLHLEDERHATRHAQR